MSQHARLSWLLALCPALVMACYADRQVLLVMTDGGAGVSGQAPTGAAGSTSTGRAGSAGSTTGVSGNSGGTAGVSGAAGVSGGAGVSGSGTAGSRGKACDPTPLWQKYFCTVTGACHDNKGSAAGFDMVTPGWERTLVNRYASAFLPTQDSPSECATVPTPYLWQGVEPAQGLFLQKLTGSPPCGAMMPTIGGPMTADELACIQSWASALVADAGGTGAAGASGAAGTGGGAAGSGGGAAGSSGYAGSGGGYAGSGGFAGSGGIYVPGCDMNAIFKTKYFCTVAGACHDGSATTAAGLDMLSAGWEQRLIGRYPDGTNESMCGPQRTPYLVAGSQPATGLFLQKLDDPPPCGQLMPTLGGPMTVADRQCIQAWANILTAP